MVTNRDEGGSCKRFTDLPRICYGSPTDHHGAPRTGLRMKDCTKDWSFDSFFNPQTDLTCQSLADSVRSGYVLGNIC